MAMPGSSEDSIADNNGIGEIPLLRLPSFDARLHLGDGIDSHSRPSSSAEEDSTVDSLPLAVTFSQQNSSTPARTLEADLEEGVETTENDVLLPSEQRYEQYGRVELLGRFFPDIDPRRPRSQTFLKKLSARKAAVLLQFTLTSIIFILNLTITAVLWGKYGASRAFGVIYSGDCSKAEEINLWIHFTINLLSTLLLGSSNYCMQLLIAPTPEKLREAHDQGKWLDIGVPSFRNRKWIKRSRFYSWTLLCLSSGLLHMMWNAAISKSTPVQNYLRAMVTSDFPNNTNSWNPDLWSINSAFLDLQKSALTNLERLDTSQCIARYMNPLAANQDLVVVVSDTLSSDSHAHQSLLYVNTSLISATEGQPNGWDWDIGQTWICWANWGVYYGANHRPHCSVTKLDPWLMQWEDPIEASKWHFKDVEYCLSRGPPPPSGCEIQFNVVILLLVCIMNLTKAVCIGKLLLEQPWNRKQRRNAKHLKDAEQPDECEQRSNHTIVLIGDAVQHFLKRQDQMTASRCLLSQADVINGSWKESGAPKKWFQTDCFLYHAASRRRWLFTYSSCFAMVIVGVAFLALGLGGYSRESLGHHAVRREGLGHSTSLAVVAGPFAKLYRKPQAAFIVAVLFSNIFQLVVSILYFMLNSLLTCLSVAQELGNLDNIERKSLRVSHPQGQQRSSYILSLPKKYSIPLIVLATLLHWFISQSVFPIRTSFVDWNGTRDHAKDGTAVGFSVLGIILSLVSGLVILLGVFASGFLRRYRSTMPMASTNSMAIAAACYRPPEDVDASLLPLRWGSVSWKAEGGVGHCAFSTEADDMRPSNDDGKRGVPQQGHAYA